MSFQDFPPALLILSPRLTVAGNPSASVVGINTIALADGSFVYCLENKGEYQLDKRDDTTPPDGSNVLAPLAGPGRWKRTNQSSGGAALAFRDTMTGVSDTAATVTSDPTGVPVLRVNGGDPLGFTVPAQVAGTYLLLWVAGSGSAKEAPGPVDGSGRPQVWPVIDGVELAGESRIGWESAGYEAHGLARVYLVSLPAGMSAVVGLRWFDGVSWGSGPACHPADTDNPTCITMAGLIVKVS